MTAGDLVVVGDDGVARCWWGASTPDYVTYHDTEWGFPVGEDHRLLEKLCLEGFQSGLSWLTILRKREAFRRAFHGFDAPQVAAMGEDDVARLLGDAGIVRHRGKIEATIANATASLEVAAEWGSFAAFVWSFEPAAPPLLATTTPESVALARELKKRGFRFVGPTTVHAFMEAMGMVDDHVHGCAVRPAVEAARGAFARPTRTTPGQR